MVPVLKEVVEVYSSVVLKNCFRLPRGVGRALLRESSLDPVWSGERFKDLLGGFLLDTFNDLGPVYGKIGQIFVTRLSHDYEGIVSDLRLTRLYGDWPALPFEEIEKVLDE